jgi:hypothetical protein
MFVTEMEQREQALIRKCEDLRHSLSEKSKELSRAQELYSKLKHRVLQDQSPGSAVGVGIQPPNLRAVAAQNNMRDNAIHQPGYGRQGQIPTHTASVGVGAAVPDYFPSSPKYPKASNAVGWSRPAATHGLYTPICL